MGPTTTLGLKGKVREELLQSETDQTVLSHCLTGSWKAEIANFDFVHIAQSPRAQKTRSEHGFEEKTDRVGTMHPVCPLVYIFVLSVPF